MADSEKPNRYRLARYLTISEPDSPLIVSDVRIGIMYYLMAGHDMGVELQHATPSEGEIEEIIEHIDAGRQSPPNLITTMPEFYERVRSFSETIGANGQLPRVIVLGHGNVDSHCDLPLPENICYFDLREYDARDTADDEFVPFPDSWYDQIDELVETLPPGPADTIVRTIEFPPELYQSGISILSYFGQVVRQKYPDTPVKVGIEQDGLKVRLIIETPDGEQKEKVERTLHEYGLVVTGQKSVQEFFEDPYQVIELRNQLRFANAQLESKRDLLASERARREAAEDQAEHFRQLLSDTLQRSHERQIALQETVQALARESNGNVREALNVIEGALGQGLSEADLEAVKRAVETVHEEAPTVFRRLYNAFIKEPLQGGIGVKILEFLLKAPSMLPSA